MNLICHFSLDNFHDHSDIVLVLLGIKNICILISLHVIPDYIWYFFILTEVLIIFY